MSNALIGKRFLLLAIAFSLCISLAFAANTKADTTSEITYTQYELQDMVNESGGCDIIFARTIDNCKYSFYLDKKTLDLELGHVVFPKDASSQKKTLVIPSTVAGVKVVSVTPGPGATFFDQKKYLPNVKKVVCSDYMAKVNVQCFNGFSSLKEIVLGRNTRSFQGLMKDFYGKKYLDAAYKVTVPEGAKYLKNVKGAIYSKDSATLYYAAPALLSAKTFKVSKNTAMIAKYAFTGVRSKTVKIPKSVKKIAKGAFLYSERLTVVVPKGQLKKYKKMIRASGVTTANKMTIREEK